jgi:hypothetical protein
VVSAFYDEVSAGKYAMSDREHVLSNLFDEMSGWPDLLPNQ